MSGDKPADLKSISPGEFLFEMYRSRMTEYARIAKRPDYCIPLEWKDQAKHVKDIWNATATDYLLQVVLDDDKPEGEADVSQPSAEL